MRPSSSHPGTAPRQHSSPRPARQSFTPHTGTATVAGQPPFENLTAEPPYNLSPVVQPHVDRISNATKSIRKAARDAAEGVRRTEDSLHDTAHDILKTRIVDVNILEKALPKPSLESAEGDDEGLWIYQWEHWSSFERDIDELLENRRTLSKGGSRRLEALLEMIVSYCLVISPQVHLVQPLIHLCYKKEETLADMFMIAVEKGFERAFNQYVSLTCSTLAAELRYNFTFGDYECNKVFGGLGPEYRKKPDIAVFSTKNGMPTGFQVGTRHPLPLRLSLLQATFGMCLMRQKPTGIKWEDREPKDLVIRPSLPRSAKSKHKSERRRYGVDGAMDSEDSISGNGLSFSAEDLVDSLASLTT